MQVILLENVKGLGHKGDVLKVKDGYYLNFLLPKRMAVLASEAALKRAKELKNKQIFEKEQIKEDAKLIKGKLDELQLVLKRKANGEKLYASITVKDLIDAVFEKLKIRLEKTNFTSQLHIKTIGSTSVLVKLNEGVQASFKVEVQAE